MDVPDIVGKVGKFLLQLAQQRKAKEAARSMDQTLAAFVLLFEKEKPVYDSIFHAHITLAAQVSRGLIKRQAVDPSPMLGPALKPFNLSVLPLDGKIHDELVALEVSRLKSSADDASQQELKVSEAMLAALKEMSSRVHLLAAEKPMHTRGNPISLKIVESWVALAI